MIGETVTHYQIVEKIGEGGMGVVYRATDTRLGRQVAVKFLSVRLSSDPSAVERFQREARAASSLSHPHICALYDVGRHRDVPFLVMELLKGRTLRRRIGGQPLPMDILLDFGVQIADALEAAHALNVVHRDIKPANIFVTDHERVKVLDFGLAKLAYPPGTVLGSSLDTTLAPNSPDLTASDQIVGTWSSMSPEQARGEDIDARSDLFSFGVVLYEMATGRQAFGGRTPAMMLNAILHDTPQPASEVNPRVSTELDRVIARALWKNREQRYQTAAALRADLESLRSAATVEPGIAVRADSKPRGVIASVRRLVPTAAAMLVSLCIVLQRGEGRGTVRGGLGPVAARSVAVLPFVGDATDSNTQNLTDGIVETLLSGLARFPPHLRVTARSVVFRYKGRDVDPQEVGRELGVDSVIAGRVATSAGRSVIHVQFLDVGTGGVLWSGEYDSRSPAAGRIAKEVLDKALDRLQPNLTQEEKKRATRGYTGDPEALRLYVQGRTELDKGTLPGDRAAIEHFQRAVQTDGRFGLAHAGLADAYLSMVSYSADTILSAKNAADEALRIDPDLAEAHVALGNIKAWLYWDWAAAQRAFERAIALNLHSAVAHSRYAMVLASTGRVADAIAEIQLARAIDPLSPSITSDFGWYLVYFGRYVDADAQFRKALDLDAARVSAHHGLGTAHSLVGRHDDAVAELKQALQLSENSPVILGHLGAAYARQQRLADAQSVLRDLQRRSLREYVPSSAVAMVHAAMGDRARALESLEKAFDEHDFSMAQLNAAPWFRMLHDDARFEKLLVKLNLPR